MKTVSGASGQQPNALCGRATLYSLRHCSIKTCASFTLWKLSRFSSSSLSFPLND
jgi:hypothetical protein